MPLRVKPMVPHQAVVPQTKSASKHIQRRRLVEVQPQAQISYSYSGNSQIVFDINSPSDFWDMVESYLRFDITCSLTNNAVDATGKYLAEGGAHSLFRTLEISTQSGTLIQRIDRYNKLYSIMSSASQSREQVDYVYARAADSYDIGDFQDAPAGTTAVRKLSANTASYTVCMQPWAPFLQLGWFPLFLVRGGFRITLTLDRPEFALASPAEPVVAGYAGANVVINNPVWACSMVTPDESLSQQYLDMYKGSGLAYNMLGYRHYLNVQSGAGTGSYVAQINANVRSAKHILAKIQDLRAETVTGGTVNSGKSTYACDSVAQGLKAGLEEYQFQAGSERFPQAKPIDMTDISNSEAFGELERVFNHMGSVVHGKRFTPVDWQERVNLIRPFEARDTADSQRLIISAELARDPTPWSGLDLSLNSLQAEFKFDAAYQLTDKDGTNGVATDRYLHMFLGHDMCIVLSESEGILGYS